MSLESPTAAWYVYVLQAASGNRTYVGITTDVARQLEQHNGERAGGARATRAGRPWLVQACSPGLPTRSAALQLEHRIKKLRGPARAAAAQTGTT